MTEQKPIEFKTKADKWKYICTGSPGLKNVLKLFGPRFIEVPKDSFIQRIKIRGMIESVDIYPKNNTCVKSK